MRFLNEQTDRQTKKATKPKAFAFLRIPSTVLVSFFSSVAAKMASSNLRRSWRWMGKVNELNPNRKCVSTHVYMHLNLYKGISNDWDVDFKKQQLWPLWWCHFGLSEPLALRSALPPLSRVLPSSAKWKGSLEMSSSSRVIALLQVSAEPLPGMFSTRASPWNPPHPLHSDARSVL